jgi:flagellar biosynthetic protein FliP
MLAAASGGSLLGISLIDGKGGAAVGIPMQITILMTLLALLPAAIMSVTPFLRISIVLHFLRQALGTQSAPSNQVLVGLSLFLSMLVISPVWRQIHDIAWVPMEQGTITQQQALEAAAGPMKGFLAKYAREKDIRL